MDRVTTDPRTPYDDPEPPAQLREACRAAGDVLALPNTSPNALANNVHTVARAASRPAPSIHFEDQRQGLPKRDIDMLAAAEMLAAALGLEME